MARIPDRGVPQTLQTGESSATMRHLWVRGSSPGRAPNPAQGVAAGGVKGTPHVPEVGMPDFDVIIVGARVAGSLTAALLGERGWRVLLLDRATFPSDTLSTHFFREPAMLAFRRAGVWDDVQAVGAPLLVNMFNDVDGVTFTEPVEGQEGFNYVLCIRRVVLDEILVRRARRGGPPPPPGGGGGGRRPVYAQRAGAGGHGPGRGRRRWIPICRRAHCRTAGGAQRAGAPGDVLWVLREPRPDGASGGGASLPREGTRPRHSLRRWTHAPGDHRADHRVPRLEAGWAATLPGTAARPAAPGPAPGAGGVGGQTVRRGRQPLLHAGPPPSGGGGGGRRRVDHGPLARPRHRAGLQSCRLSGGRAAPVARRRSLVGNGDGRGPPAAHT